MLPMLLALLTVPAQANLSVTPAQVVLDGPEATQQLLVRGPTGDVTRKASYQSSTPTIVRIDEQGGLEPVGEGTGAILVRHEGREVRVPVTVRGIAKPVPVSFEQQVIPLLTKAGCNSGGCHGKAEGQAGFKLSIFGFDAEADYQALVMESRGRRVLPTSPANSALVLKAIAKVPHGGGRKIAEGSLPHKRLVRWLTEGMRFRNEGFAPITGIEVEPASQVLALRGEQQLRVTAKDATGRTFCVTAETEFESNAPTIAGVDRRGGVQAGDIPGEAAILVRYLGHVTVARVSIPRPAVTFPRPPEVNFVDRHAWNKLTQLGIPPSALCDDATFLRRVTLDTIGTLPTAAEARTFLASTDPQKRAKWVDALLARPEYADYWALIWSDLLRVDRDAITAPGAVGMTRWLRRQFAENRPYDAFVRDIVTAEGSTTAESPAAFYKVLQTPEVMSRSLSQLFLGVRIECAQCHHHPSEKWSQDDYFALAGFFTGVTRKPIPGGDAIVGKVGSDFKHPRSNKPVPTHALGAAPPDLTGVTDRRVALARWMTAPENPFVARAIANRLWAHYFGRGLVEPLDDLRATNPASNEPLLDELAKHLRDLKYDLKAFTRTLLNSRLYQLSGAIPANVSDEQNFSHAVARPLPAEVLLDAISQTTGVPEKFNGWPEGVRAIQVWDNRMPSYFLQLFGRPVRASVCECERSNEPSIAQALHLMNAPEIVAKVHSRRGTARKFAESDRTPEAIIEELTLAVLSRLPTKKEQAVLLDLFKQAGDRRSGTEDVLWTLLNTREFVFNR